MKGSCVLNFFFLAEMPLVSARWFSRLRCSWDFCIFCLTFFSRGSWCWHQCLLTTFHKAALQLTVSRNNYSRLSNIPSPDVQDFSPGVPLQDVLLLNVGRRIYFRSKAWTYKRLQIKNRKMVRISTEISQFQTENALAGNFRNRSFRTSKHWQSVLVEQNFPLKAWNIQEHLDNVRFGKDHEPILCYNFLFSMKL